MAGSFCYWSSMRKLETCAGYTTKNTLEQGAAESSWGGKTQPGHAVLLKLWVPGKPPARLERPRRDRLRHTRMVCCSASRALVCPLQHLAYPDHSLSWQQLLVLSMLVVSYLSQACISPNQSFLPVQVGNYTCALPLPTGRGEPHIPQSHDHPRSLWQPWH